MNFAKAFSNRPTNAPLEEIHDESMHSLTYSFSLPPKKGRYSGMNSPTSVGEDGFD